MLKIGNPAPDFQMQLPSGETTSLMNLCHKGPVIVYFYPADFTPVCTRQACAFRDIHSELADTGITVIGVSPQDADSHERFRAHHHLPFPLVADPGKSIIKQYDCASLLGIRRRTFLIDREGIIRDILTADLMVSRHRAFAENAMKIFTDK